MNHLGETSTDAAHIAMGYSPNPQKPDDGQAWAYPNDTILIRRLASCSNPVGRALIAPYICWLVLGEHARSKEKTCWSGTPFVLGERSRLGMWWVVVGSRERKAPKEVLISPSTERDGKRNSLMFQEK